MVTSTLVELLSGAKFYDLTQPLFAGCPAWHAYPPVVVDTQWTIEGNGFTAERIDMVTHSGTHLDVPYHFVSDGKKLEEVPVADFQGPAVVLDMRFLQPVQPIGAAELDPFADRVQPGDIVILCTGWGEKRSLDPIFMYQWPYISGEGAAWLVDRKIRGVAIDTLSIGGAAPEAGRPGHVGLLGAGCWAVEDIRVPEELIAAGRCYLFAFPMRIDGAGGAPVRVVAAVQRGG